MNSSPPTRATLSNGRTAATHFFHECLQDVVTDLVPVAVVDGFEIVQIECQNGERRTTAFDPVNLGFDVLHEPPSILCAGQRISCRQLLERLICARKFPPRALGARRLLGEPRHHFRANDASANAVTEMAKITMSGERIRRSSSIVTFSAEIARAPPSIVRLSAGLPAMAEFATADTATLSGFGIDTTCSGCVSGLDAAHVRLPFSCSWLARRTLASIGAAPTGDATEFEVERVYGFGQFG